MVGQSQLQLNTDKSSLSILGTSSVHDWESKVNTYTVTGQINGNQIKNLKVEIITKSIKSGKSIMDSKTYDALLEDKFPKIIFEANALNINNQSVNGKGKLTLAGQTKDIQLKGKVTTYANGILKVEGTHQLVMSQYDITPPTAMFGSLVTGDEVTIKYNLDFTY
ncbi:hypothetical protein BFP72_09710 [Reichenbachiella sp. 5M10]|nr:hypothetical protein BFP72_09710 [Reichenbachiella sp. 5M10]